MIKKIAVLAVIGCFTQNVTALTQAERAQGENFDKGKTHKECMQNCRQFHRDELQRPHGHGRGLCSDVCSKTHARKKAVKKSQLKSSVGDMPFNKDIFELTKRNTFFRKEIVTGQHSQVVLMSIPVGGEIGTEHHKVDQTLIFVQGHGKAIINGQSSDVSPNHLVFVPAGAEHNFKNTGSEELKLFTIYAPAQHKPGTVEAVKSH